jgi:hypothetical protein
MVSVFSREYKTTRPRQQLGERSGGVALCLEAFIAVVRYIYRCMKIWQRWKQTALHNKALVLSSVLMALGTLFYTGAAIVQIYLFERNAAESSLQTDKLIQVAQTQACAARQIVAASERNAAAAEGFAQSASHINEGIENAVLKLKTQTEKMDSARTDADKDAKNALGATIDNFHQEQRAWLSAEPPASGAPSSTVPMNLSFPIKNSGRTPAKNVTIFFNGDFASNLENFAWGFSGVPQPLGYIAPNAPPFSPIGPSGRWMNSM